MQSDGYRQLLGSHHPVAGWKQESDQREKEEAGSVDAIASAARPLRRGHVQKRHADVPVEWIRGRFCLSSFRVIPLEPGSRRATAKACAAAS